MLDAAPSALEFKITIKDIALIKPALSIVERVYGIKMGFADQTYNNG